MAAAVVKVISMLTLYYYYSTIPLTSANNLLLQYDYNYCRHPCPEDILVFVCSVSGGGATVWEGSIFNCRYNTNEIILRHSALDNGVTEARTCNDGNIVVYDIDVTNNTYSSQLNVTVSLEMHNGTVKCIHDTLNATSVLVRVYTLILATGIHAEHNVVVIIIKFLLTTKQHAEPPGDIRISDISPNQFTIRWSPASLASNCPPATYNIATTNCGMCPNTTSDTFITCTNLTINGRICSLVVQTKACRHGSSEHSATANLMIVLSGK